MDVLSEMPYAFLGSRLKRLAEKMHADAWAVAIESGTHVPPGLYPVLTILERYPSLTVGELAATLGISQPATTRSIKELATAGLVMTQPGEKDKRQCSVVLTDNGKQAVMLGKNTIWPQLDAAVRSLVENLEGDFEAQISEIERRMAEEPLALRVAKLNAIRLEPVSQAELPAVIHLMNKAFRNGGGEAGWTTEFGLLGGSRISEPVLRQEMEDKPDATMLVWKDNLGAVRGCVWLEPVPGDTWYLGSLAVDPVMQNSKCGRRLLEAAEQRCAQKGGKRILITVLEPRETLANWYERRGYCRTGEKHPFPDGDPRFGTPLTPGLQFIEMIKELPQA